MRNGVNQLKTTLPDGRVVLFNQHEHIAYTQDYSSATPENPGAIVFPNDITDITQTLSVANQNFTPVTIRGAGTGKSGGSIPNPEGIVLAMERWNSILEIDEENHMAVVEPGVLTKTLQDAVKEKGLFYPPDPSSLEICTLGGNVAENAGGPSAFKYGVTGDYVLGLEGVWGNGQAFSLGGKRLKDVAGYDLKSLLVGSEGTLAVITKITLKLIPYPHYIKDLLLTFNTVQEASRCLRQIINSKVQPVAAEIMDRTCIDAVREYSKDSDSIPDSGAYLLLQCDGFTLESVDTQMKVMKVCAKEYNAQHIMAPQTGKETDSIWALRRNISESLKALSTHKESHDIAVPPNMIPNYFDYIDSLNTRDSIKILAYGHLGDGNLHVNVLNLGLNAEEWFDEKLDLEYELLKKAVEMGGSITGEHGIGKSKKNYMDLMFSATDKLHFKLIKNLFDPNNILNPGKWI
jgi:glycolate oxidase